MKDKSVCCIFNIGPHYDFPLYQAMGTSLGCDFYLGDKLPYAIKILDQESLIGFKGQLITISSITFIGRAGR